MNPLCYLPEEICELIFNHLSGKDLLSLSEVSTDFYDFIADSKRCMKKLKIKFVGKKITAGEKILLVESRRKYENLEIAQDSSFIEPAKEILSAPGREWKTIIMKQVEFEAISDVIEFLKIFESTVQKLSMELIYDKARSVQDIDDLIFPKLTCLETICCQALLFVEAFNKCRMLTRFKIKSGNRVSSDALEAIKKIIEKNVSLDYLEINFNIFNLIFEENISNRVRFSLKEFHANDLYQIPGASFIKVHIVNFLRNQQDSIEVLTISGWFGIEIIRTALAMPYLKDLTLKGLSHAEKTLDWEKIELNQNSSVTKLTLHDLSNKSQVLKKLVNSFPNLQSLNLFTMDQESMELVSSNCKNLKTLYAEHFLACDVSSKNLFQNLQHISFKKISNLLTAGHNRKTEERTYFENLIVASKMIR